MVRTTDAPPITAVGDAIVVSMHNAMFGDDAWDHRRGRLTAPDGEATEVIACVDWSRLPGDGLHAVRNGEFRHPVFGRSPEEPDPRVGP